MVDLQSAEWLRKIVQTGERWRVGFESWNAMSPEQIAAGSSKCDMAMVLDWMAIAGRVQRCKRITRDIGHLARRDRA